MVLNFKLRRLILFVILIASTLAAGCAIQDPPALIELGKANSAIAGAEKKGASERFPDEFAALESRYQEARGTFYACKEDAASEMARALIADANALADKRLAAPKVAPAKPANRPPVARLSGPSAANINSLLTFSGRDSSDPDNDKLTYMWDYGDGNTSKFSFPIATHRYKKIGNYTITLTVDDGRGGTDATSSKVKVSSLQVIRGDVLFDTDKSIIKSEGRDILNKIVAHLTDNPNQLVHVVGHTDSTGAEAYNMQLSQRRANAVRYFFITQRVADSRIIAEWKGESEPVASNKTAEGRAKNRRTDVIIDPAAQ